MALINPQFSKKAVSRAGDALISADPESDEYASALEIINNWRFSHDFPLRAVRKTLSRRAKIIDQSPIVAHRLKRLPSIFSKLKRLEKTRLSNMQDIGGCRVILPTVKQVYELFDIYRTAELKNRGGKPLLIMTDDYIKEPKSTGYRSLHLTLRYESLAESCKVFNGHKIEIQIRSRIQHHWATAVETVSIFKKQDLKAGEGDDRWLKFFALAGSVFALAEQCRPVPNTPESPDDLMSELRSSWLELNVEAFLNSCRSVADRVGEFGESQDFLLIFNPNEKAVNIRGFAEGQNEMATRALGQAELQYADRPEIQVVLVTVDSIWKLKDAYPNYNADTGGFIDILNSTIEPLVGRPEGLQEPNDEDLQELDYDGLDGFDYE